MMKVPLISATALIGLCVPSYAQMSLLGVGGSPPKLEAHTLRDALEKVDCKYVGQEGHDIKVAIQIIVDGKNEPNPLLLTKGGEKEQLEKRCFDKHK